MIYLENTATTKPDKEILKKAEIYNDELYYNPSALYRGGLDVLKDIKIAKENILKCLGAVNYDVIFTSCGSEADNQAIFCSVKRGTFVTDKGEHSAVYKSFLELKQRGQTVEFINLNSDGSVCEEELYNYCSNNKVDFVSIMHVNNETGAINDVNKIGKKLKEINPKIVFFVDGVQAFGKIPFSISNCIDMYSISAHKINALKGVGALIKKKNLNLAPLIYGGGQENGLRSGTENVFGIKVFEFAAIKKYKHIKENFEYVSNLKRLFISNLDKENIKVISSEKASPFIVSISCIGLRGEVVMHILEEKDIIVGNGSACSSKNRFSRVIEACGYKEDILDGVIRISFSPDNKEKEVLTAVNELNQAVKKLKRIIK